MYLENRSLPREISFFFDFHFIDSIYCGDFSPLHLIHLQFFDLPRIDDDINDDKINKSDISLTFFLFYF